MARTSVRSFLLAIALVALAAPSAAQSTGTIQGTVTDQQSAMVPGVTVVVRNQATGTERSLVTDASGEYLAAALPPGHYVVAASLTGFQDQRRDVDLEVARTAVVNIRMSLSGVSETISVIGSTPIVETSTISVGQV